MSDNSSKIDLTKASRDQIDKYNEKTENLNEKLEDYFEKERSKWEKELMPLYQTLSDRDNYKIINLQSSTLSLRHKIQDEISSYMAKLSKEMPKYKASYADRMEFYMHGYGIKTASSEKTKMVDRDLSEKKRNIELLENHIEFLRQCRYACDQIQYSVKNIVGLMNYM